MLRDLPQSCWPHHQIKTKYNINTPSLNEILEKKGPVEGFGCVARVKVTRTRNGDDMEFINVDDEDGSISLALMPNIYSRPFLMHSLLLRAV